MKKNFMMIALASVLMMPVSCTKNELEAPQGPAAGELTFVAYAEGGDSKTTLNDEDGSVAWAVGDQIKFDYELDKVAGEQDDNGNWVYLHEGTNTEDFEFSPTDLNINFSKQLIEGRRYYIELTFTSDAVSVNIIAADEWDDKDDIRHEFE